MEDWQLLRQFIDQGSQAAFAHLVERHRGLVYSTCRRELGDGALAEDAAQAVFLVLARKAKSLRRDVVLSGWLFQTAQFAAQDLRKSEQRRLARDYQAGIEMNQVVAQEQEQAWQEIDPWLHDSLDHLGPKDRDAILLRFFEDKDFAEVARALGQKEDAARHRVNRALEKMRRFLSSRGVTVPAATLGVLLTTHALKHIADLSTAPSPGSPTPAGVPAGPELVGARLYQLTQGVLRTMWMKQISGLAAGLAISILALGAGAGLVRALAPRPPIPVSTSEVGNQGQSSPKALMSPKSAHVVDKQGDSERYTSALLKRRVDEIQITGNKIVPTSAIMAGFGIHAGDAVDTKQIQRSLTHVYNLAWFYEVGPFQLKTETDGGYLLTLPVQESPGLEKAKPEEFQQQAEVGAAYYAAEDALHDHQPDKFAAMFTPNFRAIDDQGRRVNLEQYLAQIDGPLGPKSLIELNHSVTGSNQSGNLLIVSTTVTWYRWTHLPGSPDTGCEKLEQSVNDDWHQSSKGWVLETRRAATAVKRTEDPADYLRLLSHRGYY